MVMQMKQEIDHSLSISACPHDCPSTCALEVSHDSKNIFKVRGAPLTLNMFLLSWLTSKAQVLGQS